MNWKKTIVIAIDVVLAVYLVLAVTAFNTPDGQAAMCDKVKINISEGQTDGFLNAAEVKRLLEQQHLYPLGQAMQFVSLRKIEETLQACPYVEQVECHKTQTGHVCINIVQRLPVLHIMPDNGSSYYVDCHGNILVSQRLSSDLIVATGHISQKYAQAKLAPIASWLLSNKFWLNQTEQLNVLSDGTLELIPRVGDHIAYLGSPTNIPKKLERLRKFYKYGLSHAGWNQYERISVDLDNQIVCKKRKAVK